MLKCSIEHRLSAHLYISTCHNYVNILSRDPAWWQTSWQCPALLPTIRWQPCISPSFLLASTGSQRGWPLWPGAQWQILIYCPPPYSLTQSYITPTFMLLELTNVFTEKTNCAEITGKYPTTQIFILSNIHHHNNQEQYFLKGKYQVGSVVV